MTVVLEGEGLRKTFVLKRSMFGRPVSALQAVKGVDLQVREGETVAIVGESGAGKSTVGRMLVRLTQPDAGTVRLRDTDVWKMRGRAARSVRSRLRMIFQDPFSSLDPKMVVADSVGESLAIHEGLRREERRARVTDLFERVGLNNDHMERYPYEFSGGQLQRVAIARAIATNPEAVICDEPVAALDMSIRSQVLNLLSDLQQELGLAYVFITHDLSLVPLIADQLIVMYRGLIVEAGPTEKVFNDPRHPYTRALIEAIPVADPDERPERDLVAATPPSTEEQRDLPGCDYADRCPYVMDVCREHGPELIELDGNVKAACFLHHSHAVSEETTQV